MDTLNDHAARISARIEEYRTLDLIGRNSADDLQHHLRALVAERDEANALAARLADAVKHHCEHRAVDMGRRRELGMSTQIIDTLRAAIRTITFPEDDWEEIAKAQIEAAIVRLSGDDTSINDIRQSLGLPARDDMLPAPGDTEGEASA